MSDDSVFVGGRRLRCGYTTGTCATAASKAAAMMLLGKEKVENVGVTVPSGKTFDICIHEITASDDWVRCAAKKDGGDDIDATHGALVFSTVKKRDDGRILLDGGRGVGRVTRKGLDQPVGNAAINRVPRHMILEAVNDVAESFDWTSGLDITIDVPEGEAIAEKTFNPNLGIVGGVSILGTSGVVMPMSESALIATIDKEMDMLAAEGHEYILLVPGNYGKDYVEGMSDVGTGSAVKCSNFLGEALDHAVELGLKGVLYVGNIGKLVKVAGGIMNTHSRNADCRLEILAAYTIGSGGSAEVANRVLNAATTEAALNILDDAGLMDAVMPVIADRIEYHMTHRTGGRLEVGAVIFSSNHGRLCQSKSAEHLAKELDR